MSYGDWKKYIDEQKTSYRRIGSVKCPAFNDEKVYFNHYGLNHMISKGNKLRPIEQVEERFRLFKYVPSIILRVRDIHCEEKRMRGLSQAYFWTVKYTISNQLRIRIILRRLNNGTLHFYSVMRE